MHPDPQHKPYLHPNLPVLNLPEVGGRSWRRPSLGEVVKTYWQVFAVHTDRPHWRLTAWWTKEGLVHDGRANYRVPASLRSWASILWPLTKKAVRGWWSGEWAAAKKR